MHILNVSTLSRQTDASKTVEELDRPISALSMHLQKPLRIAKEITLINLAPCPYFSTIRICSVDLNVCSRLGEIPLMTL